jgi:hypothetical protein
MPLASILCGAVALMMAIGGFLMTGMPVVGSVLSFGSPLVGLAGIVLGGLGMSRARQSGEGEGAAIAGLVLSAVAFVLGLLVAITCGLCNACVTAGSMGAESAMGGSRRDPSAWLPTPPPQDPAPEPPIAQRAPPPIEGATEMPVTEEALLRHLNLACPGLWCRWPSGGRDYLFTQASCNDAQCAIRFTGFGPTEVEAPGPFQGEVRVPRAAVQPDGNGQVRVEPLHAALGPALESWALPTDSQPELTPIRRFAFVEMLNQICPDSWCEGETSFDYRHIACEEETCTLYFRHSGDEDYDPAADVMTWRLGQMEVPADIVWSVADDDDAVADSMDRFIELTDEWALAQGASE